MKNIVLVPNPNARSSGGRDVGESYLPLGLLSIAAVLQNNNYPVRFVDINGECEDLDPTECARAILDLKPDIIGFSTQVNEYPRTLKIAQLCKQKRPNSRIILGGPQASTTDITTLAAFPFVDIIVRGESEENIVPLVTAVFARRVPDGIPGITFRQGSRIVRTGAPPSPTDLSTLPMPDYSLVPNVGEFETLPVEIGRGCPFACTFCSTRDFFQRRFRFRKTQELLQLMARLRNTYGVSKFSFQHDNITVSKTKMLELCDGIKGSRLGISWSCSARVDCLNSQLIERMADAGCRRVFIGIETGSPRMQKLVRKKLDLDKVVPVVESLTACGIDFTASFMMGFPDETLDDLALTLRLMTELRFKGDRRETVQLHMASPFPGTRMLEENKANLCFDGYFSDVATPDLADEMKTWVTSHPEIFSGFYYAVNKRLDRGFLTRTNFVFLSLMRFFPYTLLSLSQLMPDYPRRLLDSVSVLDNPRSVWTATPTDLRASSAYRFLMSLIQHLGEDGKIIREVADYEKTAADLELGLVSGEEPLVIRFEHDVEGWIAQATKGVAPPLSYLCQANANQVLFLKKDGKIKTMIIRGQLARHLEGLTQAGT